MSAATRTAVIPTLLATLAASLVLVTPAVIRGQAVSSRPASVAVTVVVPPRSPSDLTSIDATVLRRTDSTLDVETVVGVAHQPVSRIEVRLGAAWPDDSARVLVRNRAGEFEELARNSRVAAAVPPSSGPDARSRLTFRLESEGPLTTAVSVPVEYRVTIGTGDQIAVWTFPAFLAVDGKR